MNFEAILSIILAIATLIGVFVSYYYYIKEIIARSASDAIEQAEQPGKKGEEKFAEAVEQIMNLIPLVLKPFITKALVEKITQAAFDKIEAYAKKQTKNKK